MREVTARVTCPFCGMPVEKPRELPTRHPREMPLGVCSCGAVYAYDATGHNLGAAFVEALVFACDMDWDLAWSLLPEEDYLTRLVEKYDGETHRIIPGGVFEGRRVAGALYFVRLHHDIQEVTAEGVRKRLQKATPVATQPEPRQREKSLYTKKDIEELVKDYRIDTLLRAVGQDKKVLRYVQRLLYASDKLLRLRAAEILGRLSAAVAREDPGAIASLLQGLYSSFADSSASSWGAIDAIGEIIGSAPEIYAGYIAVLYQLLEDELLRPDVLRALARIARARPDLLRQAVFRLLPFLQDRNPATRGYAALLFRHLGAPEARGDLLKLRGEETEIEIYEGGRIVSKTIGQVASEALANLK